MLRIGICDDEEVIGEYVEFLVGEYATNNGFIFEIEKFQNGTDLLAAESRFDMVFLDVNMPGINGIELGRILRDKNKELKIIYISAYAEYAVEAFEVKASYFLVKPIDKNKFFDIVSDIIKEFDLSSSKIIIYIKNLPFHVRDVIYIRGTKDHKIIVCTKDGDVEIRGTLKEVIKNIQMNGFINIRRGVWINPIHIQERDEKNVCLSGGETFRLARNYPL